MRLLKKITDKRILYIFTLCILVFIPVLKQISFYLVKCNVINDYDSINPAIVLYFSIPFLIYIYIKNIIKTKRKLDIYDYLFYILIFVGIVVTLFSINKEISLFGKDYRHEGLLTIFSYYLLFITWKIEGTKEDIKKIINIFIVIAIINSIYAIFQIYTPFKFILRYGLDKQMASGISGNPNFFGSLIVTVLSIVTAKYLIDKNICIKQILLIILLYISLINSQSTGPFLTYIITILFLIVYLFIKKKIVIKNMIILLLTLIIIYPSLIYINKEVFNIKRCEICDFINSTLDDEMTNELPNDTNVDNINNQNYTISNGRIDIWKNSLDIVKDNLITGVGYDNFYLGYYGDVNFNEVSFVSIDGEIKAYYKYSQIIDNAHNVYLNTLVSSGLLGLIPYLILCLLTFIKGLRTNNNLVIILLGGFVAYSIQAFANINVLQVAPIYYVIIGLILSIKQ